METTHSIIGGLITSLEKKKHDENLSTSLVQRKEDWREETMEANKRTKKNTVEREENIRRLVCCCHL